MKRPRILHDAHALRVDLMIHECTSTRYHICYWCDQEPIILVFRHGSVKCCWPQICKNKLEACRQVVKMAVNWWLNNIAEIIWWMGAIVGPWPRNPEPRSIDARGVAHTDATGAVGCSATQSMSHITLSAKHQTNLGYSRLVRVG